MSCELELLGAIKNDPGIIQDYTIRREIFDDTKYRKIFDAIVKLIADGVNEFDDIVLSHALVKQGMTYADAAVLIAQIPYSAGNVEYYVKSVRDTWRKEKVKRMGPAILADGNDIDEKIAGIEKMLTELKFDERKISYLSEVLPEMVAEIEKRFHNGSPSAISTGWHALDELLCGGFRAQELVIIGARTSIGKTTCALNLAYNAAAKGHGVGFFSAEMSKVSLAERITSRLSGVTLSSLRTGKMQPADFGAVINAGDELTQLKIMIDDTPNIKLNDLWSRARKMRRMGAGIIFVDYLTLIGYEDKRIERHERVGLISKQLKQLAREIDVPVVVMSQLNREATKNEEPFMSNIRQSGEIEEDADTIILLWREKQDEQFGNGNLKAKVEKARNARTGKFGLYFNRDCMRIEETI